jgi:hypothetical protein
MFFKVCPYLLAVTMLTACSTKHTDEVATQEAPAVDTLATIGQATRFLELDTEQYQVYQAGDSAITLPQSDFVGIPRDREPDNLRNATGVRRDGDTLIFTLKNGQQKSLRTNLNNEETSTEYIFMHNLDAIGYWEVLAFYYESFDYILVNQRDGAETHLWNKPVLSPDHKYLLCGSTDLEAGFIPNGFQLWSVENDGLLLRWEKEMKDWSAEKLIWTNNNDVWGEQTYRDNNTGELKTRLIKMRMFWSDAE